MIDIASKTSRMEFIHFENFVHDQRIAIRGFQSIVFNRIDRMICHSNVSINQWAPMVEANGLFIEGRKRNLPEKINYEIEMPFDILESLSSDENDV